ncbi:hypothetical protein NE237_020542 [Protea cynaroides]|uniref:Glycolipid transfer protein domain-containing protein n=1 Tax=Protea cynaroides TaxID=273540 RepID=A0A9Q0K2P1_9MAGN|nr:hypothetical protein NE237_020542 [Protea cynaroides]
MDLWRKEETNMSIIRNVMDEEETFEDSATPISVMADAFEELTRSISTSSEDLRLVPFCDACSLVSVLFRCLGIAFKFAELEYISKVNDLVEASKTFDTLKNILDHDVENDSVRTQGSRSRNLRRVRQGLDLIRALFEQFLSSDDCSLREAASSAYAQVCAPYHKWAIRTAVFAGMYALPSKQRLIEQLNETDHSVEKEMRRYINASLPVIEYIDKLYISKNISLDW